MTIHTAHKTRKRATARKSHKTPYIPKRSALRPHVRKGLEGACQLCKELVTAHVNRKGEWLGCPSQQAPAGKPLILMVDRRKRQETRRGPERRHRAYAYGVGEPITATANEMSPAAAVAAAKAAGSPQERRSAEGAGRPLTPSQVRAQVAYMARFPLSHDKVKKIESERDKQIYRLIAHARKGLTRLGLLAELNTNRTGIVDGAVRRLRLKGLVGVENLA